MASNTAHILAIEWLAAAQGVDFHAPLKTSIPLTQAHQLLREKVSFYEVDRLFAPDIAAAEQLLQTGQLLEIYQWSVVE